MLLTIATNRYACGRLDHVDICYPSFVDPTEVNASVIAFDGRTLTLDIEPYSFVRLNRDNHLFFGVQDKELKLIDHTTRKVGVCDTISQSVYNEYSRIILGRLFKNNPFENPILVDARYDFGKFYTGYVNPQVLFLKRSDMAEEAGHYLHGGDYTYLIGHNIVYVEDDKIPYVKELHNKLCKELNFGIPLEFKFLDTILDNL